MNSSRLRTAPLLTVSRSAQWGVCPSPPNADPLDAEHTGHVTCNACWETTPMRTE